LRRLDDIGQSEKRSAVGECGAHGRA
jgi:hypothetical protein